MKILTEEEKEDMDRIAFLRQKQADDEMQADPKYVKWLERMAKGKPRRITIKR